MQSSGKSPGTPSDPLSLSLPLFLSFISAHSALSHASRTSSTLPGSSRAPYWHTWLQGIHCLLAAAGSPGCTLRHRDLVAAGTRLEDIPGRTACLGSGSSHLAVGSPVAGILAEGRRRPAVDMARSCSSRLRRRGRRAQVAERRRCPGACRRQEVGPQRRCTSGSTLQPGGKRSVCSGRCGGEGRREMLRTVDWALWDGRLTFLASVRGASEASRWLAVCKAMGDVLNEGRPVSICDSGHRERSARD
jgi:hypothetical protein